MQFIFIFFSTHFFLTMLTPWTCRCFSLFCLVVSQIICKSLNQKGLNQEVKIVLFSEKSSQNNLISNRKQDYFAYHIGRLFCSFQAKTHLTLRIFFRKNKTIIFTCLENPSWFKFFLNILARNSIFCSACLIFANYNIALVLHPSHGHLIIFDFQSELNLFLAHFIFKGKPA